MLQIGVPPRTAHLQHCKCFSLETLTPSLDQAALQVSYAARTAQQQMLCNLFVLNLHFVSMNFLPRDARSAKRDIAIVSRDATFV